MPRKYLLSDLRFALNFVHLAAFLIISSVSLGSHASIIDTSATWDGSFNICCFGSPNFATGTFGQVFTTPADPVLLNYAFELSNRSVTPPTRPFVLIPTFSSGLATAQLARHYLVNLATQFRSMTAADFMNSPLLRAV